MISPRAKKESYTGKKIILSKDISVCVKDEISEKVFSALQVFFSSLPINISETTGKANIVLNTDETLGDKLERYTISARGSSITLSFADFIGGRNATASLYQLLSFDGVKITCPEAEIDDWADNSMRGVLLDPARRFIPVDTLKETMFRMALCKMNIAHLHLMDSEAYTLECNSYPEINDEEFGYYKKDEMRKIIEYGQIIGINCIPEIETPGHAAHLTTVFPFLKCETESTKATGWTMCVGSESFYEFFTNLINELAEIFPYNIIHIGTDEFSMYDRDDLQGWPSWHDCMHCRAVAEKLGIYMTPAEQVIESQNNGTFKEKGISGTTEMFYYMLKRMHKIVTDAGKRMMMWNENIDISKECDLPRDILIHFWRIAKPYRGPILNCSLSKFVEAGFEVINSHYPQTYVEGGAYYPQIELSSWAPKVYPEVNPKYVHNIIGGWPAAWSNYPHYEYTMPSILTFYSDRLWDETSGLYGDDYCKDITKLILGPTIPEGFNVFAALGGHFIPRNLPTVPLEEMKFGNLKTVKISKEEVLETERVLRTLESEDTIEGRTAGIYANCVHWVYEQLNK